MPFADWPVAVKNFTPARSRFLLLAHIRDQGAADHFLRPGDGGRAGIGETVIAVAARAPATTAPAPSSRR